jgi:hypothetical protein
MSELANVVDEALTQLLNQSRYAAENGVFAPRLFR